MKGVTRGILALVFAWGAGQARADFLVNGGFETGSFSGWSQGGNTAFTFVSASNPNSGSYAAWLGPVGSLGFLSQTIATTPGANYTLSFALANTSSTANAFQVMFGGATVFNQANMASQGYTPYQFTVTATSSSTVLQLGFHNDPGFFFLDGVSLTGGPVNGVPEPAGLTLLALGLAALGGRAWRRRRAALP